MQFRKEVKLQQGRFPITLDTNIGVFGSCFAWEVAEALEQELYNVWRSPFGISYNPLSIAAQINRLCHQQTIEASELFEHQGLWHSFAHHGSYSAPSQTQTLEKMQDTFSDTTQRLRETNIFIFTWGTAYYYELKERALIVNNCHKLNPQHFNRLRLSTSEILKHWTETLDLLLSTNPEAKFIFTISPVPHYSDGLHEHTVSKAILHCALDELLRLYPSTADYFPAYEIMREELRDYRFYKEDFAHPTPMAVGFIMEKFRQSFTTQTQSAISDQWQGLRRQLGHRPLSPDNNVRRAFYDKLISELSQLLSIHEHPTLRAEMTRIKSEQDALE